MPRRTSSQNLASVSSGMQQNAYDPSSGGASENLIILRRQWKWAAFSQFFHIFVDLFAMADVSLHDIENDFVHGTCVILPRIMQRLLFTLSYDRKISADNWQEVLRKQYNKRDPHANPFVSPPHDNSLLGSVISEDGHVPHHQRKDDTDTDAGNNTTEFQNPPSPVSSNSSPGYQGVKEDIPDNEASGGTPSESAEKERTRWIDLPMLQKLDSLHTVVEWQFQNPLRLRTIMKSDDETATWRSEPVGYDKVQNSYWLIGGNRLWIQRKAPKPSLLKRKRGERNLIELKAKLSSTSVKRLRVHKQTGGEIEERLPQVNEGRGSRAAKEQAKLKLNTQAKELAEFNRQVTLAKHNPTRKKQQDNTPKKTHPQLRIPRGVRMSARLRGAQEDEWQRVPDEWLTLDQDDRDKRNTVNNMKTGLESGSESISDLTELSEEMMSDSPKQHLQELVPEQDQAVPPHTFIEWETVCATLPEWESFANQLSNSTHYTEKALYRHLVHVLVPQVTAELKHLEQKRLLDEALIQRKRSSRLATKESEKEAARLADKQRVEEAEKQSRAKRLEARLQKENVERQKREKAREQRRTDREAREASRNSRSTARSANLSADNSNSVSRRSTSADSGPQTLPNRLTKTESHTPAADDWELDCEVCGRRGSNIDDGTPMMSCGFCSKWQHILCHDRLNQTRGRPKHDWDSVEFFCQRCLTLNGVSRSDSHKSLDAYDQRPLYPSKNASARNTSFTSQEQAASRILSSFRGVQASNIRSSTFVSQPANPIPPPPSNISFSHYQPHEQAFTSDSNRIQSQQYIVYNRQHGQQLAEAPKQQTHPAQQDWRPSGQPQPSAAYHAQNSSNHVNGVHRQQFREHQHQRHHDHNRSWETRFQPPLPSLSQNQLETTQYRFHSTSYSPQS